MIKISSFWIAMLSVSAALLAIWLYPNQINACLDAGFDADYCRAWSATQEEPSK